MCLQTFCTTFVWNVSYSLNNSVRYSHKCTQVSTFNTHYSCHILIKLQFSQEILKNPQIPNLMKIFLLIAELFHVETQRHTHKEDNRHFFAIFQLCLTNPLVTKRTTLWVNMSENENSVTVLTESFIRWIIKVCRSADTRSQIDTAST